MGYDNDNSVNGDSATGNKVDDDGNGATGDDNDDDDDSVEVDSRLKRSGLKIMRLF
jgi:hypothetical protein